MTIDINESELAVIVVSGVIEREGKRYGFWYESDQRDGETNYEMHHLDGYAYYGMDDWTDDEIDEFEQACDKAVSDKLEAVYNV